jgi:hypothetical protein
MKELVMTGVADSTLAETGERALLANYPSGVARCE